MARVLIATQAWGVIQDRSGNVSAGTTVSVKNTDATAATHWSAQVGGSSLTSDPTTDSNGYVQRWIEEGQYDVTVGGVTQRVQASAGTPKDSTAGAQRSAFAKPGLLGDAQAFGMDNWKVLGVDTSVTPNRVLTLADPTNSTPAGATTLRQSEDGGVTWSFDKGRISTYTTQSAYLAAIYWNGFVYVVVKPAGAVEVWRSAMQSGNTAFSWTKVHTLSTGTFATADRIITATSTALIVCEGGDPTGGPQIWRSTNGTSWTSVAAADSRFRHFHNVAADPYNDGHVYVSCGDDVSPWTPLPCKLRKSTDHGATWADFGPVGMAQNGQVSFSRDWIWLATDDGKQGTVYLCSRDGSTWKWASTTSHRNLSVAGSPGSDDFPPIFDTNAYQGAVDPSTEVYYGATIATAVQQIPAMTFALPRIGAALTLIGTDLDNAGSFGPVYIGTDYVYVGFHKILKWAGSA